MKRLIIVLLATCIAAQAGQLEASVAAERARLSQARERTEAEFKAEEKACYSKFAVNDCVAAAKAKRREAMADLRRQEIALNDAERKRKAAERSRSIDEKAASARPAASAGASMARQPAPEVLPAPQREERAAAAAAAQHERDVQRRMAEARAKQQRRAQDAAERKRSAAVRAEQAHERQEKLRQRLAQRKRPPASSLEDPR